ncbi:adenylyl-sulfate kinase [Stenotrophomonas sp. 22692]|uniref:adenylyl-sulfate kinase n=1 Tax=Stenotrophomonas sp. 22692 TaxID=3453956 RepID=UPI003F84C071
MSYSAERYSGTWPICRLMTCGGVDDGKSTLIGRLLYEVGKIPVDQLHILAGESARYRRDLTGLDFALLLDGLEEEQQGQVTIDVGYRHLETAKRRFLIADCPGHAQYIRNMVTAASMADIALLLVDARRGLTVHTRRHARVAALLGVKKVVLAVNKMDLVGFERETYIRHAAEFRLLMDELGIKCAQAVPISASEGSNIVIASDLMSWYSGPTLLSVLEEDLESGQEFDSDLGFRMPIQWVNPSAGERRCYTGEVLQGAVSVGEVVMALPSGIRLTVSRLIGVQGEVRHAQRGDSVAMTFDEDVAIGRGDVIADVITNHQVGRAFSASIICTGDTPIETGRSYELVLGTARVQACITRIDWARNLSSGEEVLVPYCEPDTFCGVQIETSEAIAFESYQRNRIMGGFILVDRETNSVASAGTISIAQVATFNRLKSTHSYSIGAHDAQAGTRVVWITGISGAGKTTCGELLVSDLRAAGIPAVLIDGDVVRAGLCQDLLFTPSDKAENCRRIAEVARLIAQAGIVAVVSAISPYEADRRYARSRLEKFGFMEVHLDASLDLARSRDPKDLYKRAQNGLVVGMSGMDAPYEVPSAPELRLDAAMPSRYCADRILTYISDSRKGERGSLWKKPIE